MGEIIDMQAYRMRKTAQRFLESKGATIGTAADLLRARRLTEGTKLHESALSEIRKIDSFKYPSTHPAGRGITNFHEGPHE